MTTTFRTPSGLIAIANREGEIAELIRTGKKSLRECSAELAELHAEGSRLVAEQDKRWAQK